MEKEEVNAFINALRPEELAHQVHAREPKTLDDAVRYAKNYFELQTRIRPNKQVRVIESTPGAEIDDLRRQIQQLQTRLQDNQKEETPSKPKVKCYNCGKEHFARGCPYPRARRSGNE
jgi:lysyl-tRNA synthetase class I